MNALSSNNQGFTFTKERALELARGCIAQYVDGRSNPYTDRVAEIMVREGCCVWHASAIASDTLDRCPCARCRKEKDKYARAVSGLDERACRKLVEGLKRSMPR